VKTRNQKNIARLFFSSFIIVISILTVIILVVSVASKYLKLESDLKKIENQFLQEQIQSVKSRVKELIDYIAYNKSQTEQILKEQIKERTYEAYHIAKSLFNAHRYSKSTIQIKRLIRDTLRTIRFHKNKGYYFIDDLEGNIVLYPTSSHREGESALNDADIKGKYIVRDFIDIAQSQEEGFSTYYFYKQSKPRKGPVKKISFIKLFKPLNWIIGTGEYVEDVEKDIQKKVIMRINSMRFGKEQHNYYFLLQILDINSEKNFVKTLVNPNRPDLVGKTMNRDFKDDRGNEFLREAIRQLKENGEAVVHYWFKKMDIDYSAQKTTYLYLYKDWDWVIGAGFHHDDMQTIITQRKSELGRTVLQEILLIIGIFIMISILAILFSRFIAQKIKNEFDVFSNFFRDSAKKNELLDKNKLHVSEFRELADLANSMITEKKDSEKALLKSKELAEAATRAKSEFLANVSHEIRTPMTAIIGMSDILAQTSLSEEQYEYLEIITTSANNLLVIINDILDFSKIEAGRMNIDRINFNIREIIEGVADMVAPRAHKKQLELITLIEPEIPEQVLGDSSRLHQILLNLTNNAVKFTDTGEIVISAELGKLKENEKGIKILFKVRDTGIGISEKDRKYLFKTFSQLDTTSTRKYGGTGLGLAISKKLTQLMKGEIGVESEENQGSTFWFTCLFEQAEENAGKTTISTSDFKNLRVLIVDDNRTNRLILRKYLEVLDCHCEEAENAKETLDILHQTIEKKQPFDIVLLDFQMPEISGDQLAEKIKSEKRLKTTPLILLSSSTAYQTHEELRENGFADLLYKPIKQSQLTRSIGKIMGFFKPDAPPRPTISKTFPTNQSSSLKILLVEDNTFNQKVAIFNLQKYNHHVELAENGKIAIEKFEENKYDLVLMDIQMPVMDGYEATKVIRSIEKERSKKEGIEIHTPIIAMTANAMKEDEERAIESGMDSHLSKPFNAEKLIAIVHRVAYQEKDQ